MKGFLWAVFDSGPWLGLKFKNSPLRSFVWLNIMKREGYHHHVWRHTCFALSSRDGRLATVENGVKFRDNNHEIIVDWFKNYSSTPNFASVGCALSTAPEDVGHMSMYGRVTDLQIFNRLGYKRNPTFL